MASLGIPISEYVIESYVRDSFFRQDTDIHRILERLVPASIEISQNERLFLAQYIAETRDDFKGDYNIFLDKDMGPIRQRVAELHTAVIALVAQLSAPGMDTAWLPKHAFVTLSQLQVHAANLLEDLDFEEAPEKRELDGMENSLDGMIDTYEDIKEAIDQALNGFRRSRISLVKPKPDIKTESSWRTIQAALVGTGVWRRLLVSDAFNLEELHRCLLAAFGWKGGRLHGFVIDGDVYGPSPARDAENGDKAEQDMTIAELAANGISEIEYDYDYGAEWELRITLLHTAKEEGLPRCVAGQGAAPPEHSGGALRYRRFVSALKGEAGTEQDLARSELGSNFDPDAFNLEEVNTALAAAFSKA
ncbi:hypothetical protein MASR2M78_33180 [Treponema sp.]